MKRELFEQLVREALDALPAKFRDLVRNLVVVIEDQPPPGDDGLVDEELMGIYDGVPLTERGAFDAVPPDRIVLYQHNIEAICETDDEMRGEVRLTILHELGHYFGMDEDQLEDV